MCRFADDFCEQTTVVNHLRSTLTMNSKSLKVLTKGSSRPPPVQPGVVRLYGMRLCPFVQRAWLVLTIKGITYEMVNIHLIEKPEWYTDVNPGGKVPALEFDKKLITESLVIADYLDDAYPQNKLNPSDPYERARNRMLLEQFNPLTNLMPIYLGTSDDASKWWEEYQKNMEFLEKELATRKTPYFAGNAPGMLDYMTWPWMERVGTYPTAYSLKPFDTTRFPKITAWSALMSNDKIVKKIALSIPIHIEFLNSMRSGKVNYDLGL